MSDAAGYDEYAFVAELYDFVPMYRDRDDVAFFVDAAKEAGAVLEVGCGTGRVLIPSPYGSKYPGELIFVAKKSA